jgi:hypothetical protein
MLFFILAGQPRLVNPVQGLLWVAFYQNPQDPSCIVILCCCVIITIAAARTVKDNASWTPYYFKTNSSHKMDANI